LKVALKEVNNILLQNLNRQTYFADEIVVTDDNTGDGGEEDGICGEVGSEIVGRGEKIPWAHSKAHSCANITPASNVDVPRE